MRDGRRCPHDIVAGQAQELCHPERAVHLGIVAVHDTLGLGFGARGENKRSDVAAGEISGGHLGLRPIACNRRPQPFKWTHAVLALPAQHKDVLQRWQLRPHRRIHRWVVELAIELRDDRDFALCQPQDVGQLARTVVVQERVRDGTQSACSQVDHDEFGGVVELNRNDITRANAKRTQIVRDAIDLGGKLPVREPYVAADDGDLARVPCNRRIKVLDQVLADPVALALVALRDSGQ